MTMTTDTFKSGDVVWVCAGPHTGRSGVVHTTTVCGSPTYGVRLGHDRHLTAVEPTQLRRAGANAQARQRQRERQLRELIIAAADSAIPQLLDLDLVDFGNGRDTQLRGVQINYWRHESFDFKRADELDRPGGRMLSFAWVVDARVNERASAARADELRQRAARRGAESLGRLVASLHDEHESGGVVAALMLLDDDVLGKLERSLDAARQVRARVLAGQDTVSA